MFMRLFWLGVIIAIALFIWSPWESVEAELPWQQISNYDTSGHDLSTQQGLWAAQIQIGDELTSNSTGSEDLQKAKYWYEKAANSGSTEAMFLMAKFYSFQPENDPSAEISIYWFEKAAKQGHLPSIMQLAHHYINEDKLEDASTWLLLAIDQGELNANMILGDLYFQGTDKFTQDLKKAISYYRPAAEKGHTSSQLRIGIAYFQGMGVEKNPVEAYKWITLAGVNGNGAAKSYWETQLVPALSEEEIAQGKVAVETYQKNQPKVSQDS